MSVVQIKANTESTSTAKESHTTLPLPLFVALPTTMLKDEQSHLHRAPDDTNAQPVTTLTPNPTVITLFSLLPRNYLFLLAFAICLSSVSGGLAPFMTYVVGQVFDAFGAFSAISKPSPTDRSTLLRSVGISSLQLLGLAFGSIILGSATSYVWIWTGEVNTMTVRKHVFRAVMEQDLFWFDSQTVNERGDGPVGSGGLMTKFSKFVASSTAGDSDHLTERPTTSGWRHHLLQGTLCRT